MSNNLREKFKLLRQWQIQQEEDFLRKQIEYKQSLQRQGTNLISDAVAENGHEIESNNLYNANPIGGFNANLNDRDDDSDTKNSELLQRMSPSSLQRALSSALDDIEVDEDDKTATEDHNDQIYAFQDFETDEEYPEDDVEDKDEIADGNLWDKSTEMQTVVFKPKISNENGAAADEIFSSASSVAGSLNEIDGVFPIVYSEDNFSENENDGNEFHEEENESVSSERENEQMSDDIINDNVPFDEIPAKSKLGNDVSSFEELVEKQLLNNNERTKVNQASMKKGTTRKPFLRKGDGIARFRGSAKMGHNFKRMPDKQTSVSNAAVSLPKTSLKLLADSKPRGIKVSGSSADSLKSKIVTSIESQISRFQTIPNTNDEEIFTHSSAKSSAVEQEISRENSAQNDFAQTSPAYSIEASFQKMLLRSNAREKVDDEELEEFELLEEAAADTSLSSNASVVVRMMAKASSKYTQARNATSSPLRKPSHQIKKAERQQTTTPLIRRYKGHPLSVNMEDSEEDDAENSIMINNPDLIRRTNLDSGDLPGTKDNDELQMTSVEFHDQSAWADTTQLSQTIDDHESTITESPNMKSNQMQSLNQASLPPTSNLMKQFFPILQKDKHQPVAKETMKAQSNKDELKVVNETRQSSIVHSREEISTQNASDVLKEKLSELENEIAKFRHENADLEKLKIEREKDLSKLRNEVDKFQKQRADELERIEKFKDEEMRKIKRERKLFEKYQKEARTIPNKKDREEIESLKQQIEELQDELKRRETRWNGSAARFRKRIEDIENENYELKENIKILEKERLQQWSKREKTSENSAQNSKHKEDQSSKSIKDMIYHSSYTNKEISPQQNPMKNQRNTSESPRGLKQQTSTKEILKASQKTAKKVELSPRDDVVPQEQPPTPRKNGKVASSLESSTQRLSLTPEKHAANQENQDSEMRYSDGKVERILSNGSREITFPNGTRKTIDPTNQSVVISFFNGDMKQILPDDRVVYYYAESKTTHTTCKDGLEIFEFSNEQIEKHYPNGRKEIIYPDKTVKCIFVNGAEETVFADGTIQNLDINGERTISFPNGQREIHTQNYKRREYPDGTMKTVYQDGRQETRYASGRLRIKDPNGNVLVDTGIA